MIQLRKKEQDKAEQDAVKIKQKPNSRPIAVRAVPQHPREIDVLAPVEYMPRLCQPTTSNPNPYPTKNKKGAKSIQGSSNITGRSGKEMTTNHPR